MSVGNEHSVPRKKRDRQEAITEITDEFCQQHLTDGYADLARKMAALSRKSPQPLEGGRTRSWAAGIVYALGRVNFLSDPSREPHMKLTEMCERIGVSLSNALNKSRGIWNRLDLMQLHQDWCLPSMVEENLRKCLIEVNSLPVDVRALRKEVQEEAFRLGLIPCVPQHDLMPVRYSGC